MDKTQGYRHEALTFTSAGELVNVVVPTVRQALDTGEDVVLVCTDDHNEAIVKAVRDERVTVLDRPEVYRKAVSAVAYYRDMVLGRLEQGRQGVRVIGEVDFGSTPRQWLEWRRFEALCNHVLAPLPLSSLCAYDTTMLPDAALDTAALTHPLLRRDGAPTANPAYVDPATLLRRVDADVTPPDGAEVVSATLHDAHDLRRLRELVREVFGADAFGVDALGALTMAAHEIATNGLVHGRPPVVVRTWATSEVATFTVTDQGEGFDDAYAGYLPGETTQTTSRGLWLARQLCDEVSWARTSNGFTVRLSVYR